ncbi:uncharacterized protein [Musca autumnalis]|uniref:uncharacterized protein n=1 Tax=Musca autumnalis TaxID=221902 RepID=UPI003CE9C87D
MTPFDDFSYLINFVLLGEEPTIEDFILLVGTFVAFVAFILWCCFPIQPKDSNHRQFSCKTIHSIDNTSQQIHTNYSKTSSSNSLIYNDYVVRNVSSNAGGGQTSYHCCT